MKPRLTDQLRDLKEGKSIFFPLRRGDTIKTTIQRLKGTNPEMSFATKSDYESQRITVTKLNHE